MEASADVVAYYQYLSAQIKVKIGAFDEAIDLLKQSQDIEPQTYSFLNNDVTLDPIRNMPKFLVIMKKYFPEKYMD